MSVSRSSSPEAPTPDQGRDASDWARDGPDRAQLSPLPALGATVVVIAALSMYATGLFGAFPDPSDPRVAEPTLQRAVSDLAVDGVVRPTDLSTALSAAPSGYDAALVLTADDDRWRVGPASPPDAATASTPVSVRLAPGVVVPGRLRVEVWR